MSKAASVGENPGQPRQGGLPACTAGDTKCPTFTMICAYIRPMLGQARPMTARFQAMSDEEFEVQVRNLVRIVSACTLGLWSFSAGLLIGSFYLS